MFRTSARVLGADFSLFCRLWWLLLRSSLDWLGSTTDETITGNLKHLKETSLLCVYLSSSNVLFVILLHICCMDYISVMKHVCNQCCNVMQNSKSCNSIFVKWQFPSVSVVSLFHVEILHNNVVVIDWLQNQNKIIPTSLVISIQILLLIYKIRISYPILHTIFE